MRRTFTPLVALVLAHCLAAPAARAAGPGTTLPGLGEDPFTGRPVSGPASGPAARGGGASFTFFGSGYGHGLGMSQWGAYGLARMGWSHARILTHFYRGTRVRPDPKPVKALRVGITYDRSVIHLGARSGPVKLWIGRPRGNPVGRIPGGTTWTVKATPTGYAVRDANGNLVGGKRWGGRRFHLYATYADAGSRVFVPEADAVSGAGYSYHRSHLELNLYRTGGAWRLRAILPLALERYLYGIGEVPSSWPAQALRAQAVASRTFATRTVREGARRGYCNCDITDGANDQVYVGSSKELGTMGKRWVRAVDATRRRIVTHGGRAILAVFAASDGGHSDSVEDVWHGGNPAFKLPYLKAECDPGEDTAANPWVSWKRSLTVAELTRRLAPYTGGIGRVQGFPGLRRGDGGRVITATVRGASGTTQVTGAELRAAISAWDGRIWVNRNRNVTGPIRDAYDRLMCRPGLPVSGRTGVPGGARQRFQRGAIYRDAKTGVTVWLRGPVHTEYLALGGPGGKLGLPTSKTATVRRRAGGPALGVRSSFRGGRVFAKAGARGHALWGPVLKAYLGRGGAAGPLGFPTSRVRAGGGGTTASFQHGRITCRDGTCSVSS